MFGFVADRVNTSQFVHVIEMDDGTFCLISSSQLFVYPFDLKKIGGANRAAVRICCTRRAGPDAEVVLSKAAQILKGKTANARRTYIVSEKAATLTVELACELVAVPRSNFSVDETDSAEWISRTVQKSFEGRDTNNSRNFGIVSKNKSQATGLEKTSQVDYIFENDAIGVACCLRASRAGDTVTILGAASMSASERTLFEWHGVKVVVAE